MAYELEKLSHIALLFDFYGVLLTEKQKTALNLFYNEDCTLNEIAEEFATSRQAVFDLIRRSEAILEKYEKQLKIAAKHQKQQLLLDRLETKAHLMLTDKSAQKEFFGLLQTIKEGE